MTSEVGLKSIDSEMEEISTYYKNEDAPGIITILISAFRIVAMCFCFGFLFHLCDVGTYSPVNKLQNFPKLQSTSTVQNSTYSYKH